MISLKSGQKLLSGQWESRASIPGTLALHNHERLQFQGGCGARSIGKSLPWKHKDLSSAPHSMQNPCKKTGVVVYTYLSMKRWRQADPQAPWPGSVATWWALEWVLKQWTAPEEESLRLSSGFHMHTHAQACTCAHANQTSHIQNYTDDLVCLGSP